MLRYISASEAVMMLADEDEVAFLDIRELVPFGTGHPLLATNLPLSRMEFVESVARSGLALTPIPELSARELEAMQQESPVRITDVGQSEAYVRGHIPGAVWCSRVALDRLLREEAHDGPTVLTSEEGVLARLAATDLDMSIAPSVSVLAGGNTAWREAGFALSNGVEQLASPRDDHWLASSERPGDTRQNVLDYLAWEETLLDDIERGGMSPYHNLIWR
jgi:3-mercaptopyruvate sulfurtransferase SseA